MAKTFRISEANPIPFVHIQTLDPTFNTFPPLLRRTPRTVNGCYLQKWEYLETTTIQYLSDYDETEVSIKVYKNNGQLVATIPPVEVVTSLVGYTFKAYQVEFDFSDYGYGYFYAEITFTDENNVLQTYQSELWQTADKWPRTLAWDYKNEYNCYDLIFDTTDFNPRFRLESSISKYTPDSDAEVYIDQMHTPSQLSSIPFDRYILNTDNLPDWALRILNYVLNVTEKKADGQPYEKPDGAKLEVQRSDGYEYGAASVEVIPVTDFFLNRLIVGDNMAGEYVIITKRLQWIDNAVNRTITGKFKVNSMLRRIDIINKGGTAFTMNVGTTNGGSELGQKVVEATDATACLVVLHPFDSSTDVYITGVDTAVTNLFVIYDQDDEVSIPLNPGTGGFQWPKGFCGWWTSSSDEAITDVWDLASGLGKAGTMYENCAIRDGRNGTENELGAYDVSVDSLGTAAAELNTTIGANSKNITRNVLPAEGINIFVDIANGSPADKPGANDLMAITSNYGSLGYEIHKGGAGPATVGKSGNLGLGQMFDVRAKSFKKLPFKAIS